MKHRLAIVAGLIVGLTLAWFFWSRSHLQAPESPAAQSAGVPVPAANRGSATSTRVPSPVDALNAASGTIQNDARLLQEVFVQWQTNFSGKGNPVGTNAEITAALTGKNSLQLDLIPRDHPAINVRGELCDRWGTPFRFHQLSGTNMQIISAGPDRDFATADDVAVP